MRPSLIGAFLALITLTWLIVIVSKFKETERANRTAPVVTPVLYKSGLPDDAILEETLSNNWKVVRIKGQRFLFRNSDNGLTLCPLLEEPKQ